MVLAGCSFLFASCTGMDKDYKEYIQNGEIVYRAKADSVQGFSGKNRALITWKLKYPTLVTKCEIREGDKVLAEIPVTYQDSIQFSHILTGLNEKTYTFSIYALDADGNSSIKSNVIVDILGERYINSLRTTRSIQEVLKSADNPQNSLLVLNSISSAKVVGTDIQYSDMSGTLKTIRLLKGSNQILLKNADFSKGFQLEDLWIPTITAIDTFPAPKKEFLPEDIPSKLARTFTSIYRSDATTIVAKLSAATSSVKNTIIKYGDKEINVAPATTNITLNDVPATATISMTTVILDTESGNDFYTQEINKTSQDILTKVDMSNWSVVGFSSQQESGEGAGGGHTSHAIDNNISTFWHTQYSPNQPAFPHFLTVDMKEEITVKSIAVARRQGNANFASRMKLEVSQDGTTWIKVGEFFPVNTTDNMQFFSVTPTIGRYFKLTALASATSATYTCISEINIFK